MNDPLTGVTLTHTWGGDDRLTQVDYSSGPRRTISYNPAGRIDTDTLYSSSAQTTKRYETVYGYDLNGNTLSKTIGPAGVAGVGTHTYAYDKGDRLTSWTAPGAAATIYEYDNAGNRTRAGSTWYRYDARNRLCYESTTSNTNACGSAPPGATNYTWSARGTMSTAGAVYTTNRVLSVVSGVAGDVALMIDLANLTQQQLRAIPDTVPS